MNRFKIILAASTALLLIPFIAMQFTEEVNWKLGDFIIAGALLISTGLLIELVIRKVQKPNERMIFIFALVILFFLVWAELAVGIFGTPFGGQ